MEIKDYALGLQHIGVPTENLEKTVEFYEALGFTIAHATVNEATGQRVRFMKLQNVVMEVYDIHFLPYWENGVKFFTIEGPNKEKVEFSQYL